MDAFCAGLDRKLVHEQMMLAYGKPAHHYPTTYPTTPGVGPALAEGGRRAHARVVAAGALPRQR